MTNLEWIAAGNTGCTFATLFARKPELVGWQHLTLEEFENWEQEYAKALVISVEFPSHWTIRDVRDWALDRKIFYEEEVDEECLGLRIEMKNHLSRRDNKESAPAWVQYFGEDSHVPTRQAPNPMLMWTRKINPLGYVKQVGWNGILHLAHAFSSHITQKMADTLWKRSYEQVKKKIGHSPTIKEAAKTTWLKTNVL
jgi:hypothetical protein